MLLLLALLLLLHPSLPLLLLLLELLLLLPPLILPGLPPAKGPTPASNRPPQLLLFQTTTTQPHVISWDGRVVIPRMPPGSGLSWVLSGDSAPTSPLHAAVNDEGSCVGALPSLENCLIMQSSFPS